MTAQKDNRPTVFILLGIILLGALLRIYNLASKTLWYDDITSLAIAAKSLRFIVTQYPGYKSAYIIMLKAWTGIFGISAAAVTMLPAVSGIASVFLTFRIGKDVCNTRVGLISSFLLSISCFHIYHSREVKQYAMLLFLILLSIFFFIKFFSERKTKFIILNVLLNIAILFVHPFGFSLVLVQILHILIHRRLIEKVELKKWFLAQILLLFAFGVWLAVILNAKNHLQAVLWWVPRPDILSLATTFRTFCYGASYGLSDVTVQSCPAVIAGIVIIIFGLFFIKGLFVIFTSHLQNHVRLFIIWLFLPVALTFLFSYIFFPVYVTKHLLILLPAFYYIIAIGLSHKAKAPFIITVLLIIFALNIIPLRIMYKAYAGADWHKAAQLMKDHSLKDNDIIIMATTKEVVCLIYYLSGADKEALREIGIFGRLTDSGWQESFKYKTHYIITLGSELPGLKDSRYNPCYNFDGDFDKKVLRSDVLKTNRRIWLLISRWSGIENGREREAQALGAYFKMAFREQAPGIMVYRFEPYADFP